MYAHLQCAVVYELHNPFAESLLEAHEMCSLEFYFFQCRAGRSSQSIARFAHQFPLKSEPILNSDTYPSFTFTANRFNVTALVADRVDGREVLFLGTGEAAS